jgi:hypothetical protein
MTKVVVVVKGGVVQEVLSDGEDVKFWSSTGSRLLVRNTC